MDTPIVIEGKADPRSILDWLEDYGRTGKISGDELAWLFDAGYVFDVKDGNFTDLGFKRLEELGVPVKEINVLVLGTDLHIPIQEPGRKKPTHIHLKAGSQVLVVFGGKDNKTQRRWYDIKAGDSLPILRVYENSANKFETHLWPALWPLKGTYQTAP